MEPFITRVSRTENVTRQMEAEKRAGKRTQSAGKRTQSVGNRPSCKRGMLKDVKKEWKILEKERRLEGLILLM